MSEYESIVAEGFILRQEIQEVNQENYEEEQ